MLAEMKTMTSPRNLVSFASDGDGVGGAGRPVQTRLARFLCSAILTTAALQWIRLQCNPVQCNRLPFTHSAIYPEQCILEPTEGQRGDALHLRFDKWRCFFRWIYFGSSGLILIDCQLSFWCKVNQTVLTNERKHILIENLHKNCHLTD